MNLTNPDTEKLESRSPREFAQKERLPNLVGRPGHVGTVYSGFNSRCVGNLVGTVCY